MKKVKITVVRKVSHDDLIEKYENPMEQPCDMEENEVYISSNGQKPVDFCESAWNNLFAYVFALASGGGDFHDGWMKNKKSAMISCNDGFRPVSFLLETVNEEDD